MIVNSRHRISISTRLYLTSVSCWFSSISVCHQEIRVYTLFRFKKMLNHLIRPWAQPNVVMCMRNAITRCRGCRWPWLLTYGRWMNLKGEISKPEGHSTVLRKKERRELSRIQQQLLSHLFLLYIFIAESEYLFTYWACKV